MSVNLTINGVTYAYPQVDDTEWGPEATDWAVAVTQGMLQKAGGTFQLTAEVDFGTSYGLKSLYYKSRTSNVASAGQIRLARADEIAFRNQANNADLILGVNSSNNLTFNGVEVVGSFSVSDTSTIDLTLAASVLSADIKTDCITNAMINSAAAIAYSKLNLSGSIVNADINASAAIAYSKLNLSGSIVNADISASAAIAFSKLASLTSANILVGNGSNVATAVPVTGDISLSNAGVTAYSGIVPLSKGGTNKNMTAVAGGVVYTDSDSMEVTSAGTSGQYLKSNGSSAPAFASFTPPTSQIFTSGSGTYTTPAGVLYLRVRMVGGGGGGSGSADSSFNGGNGGNGGDTTFGSTVLVAGGGVRGLAATSASSPATGGAGGTASTTLVTSNAYLVGGSAGSGGFNSGSGVSTVIAFNIMGGTSFFGGGSTSGVSPASYSGSGGAGARGNNASNFVTGSGGGSGGYAEAIILSPAASYAYAVGAGGTAGSAGTNGTAGQAGASGRIIVEEFYQ